MVTPPGFIKKLFSGNFFFDIPSSESDIFLTFDDGPTPDVTEFIIAELEKYNAKATFFCVGENIVKYPKTFQLYLDHGHSIGNHTYNHLNGWKTSDKDYIDNVRKFDDIYKTELFRPPYGKLKPSQYNVLKAKYKIYLWSVITGDYKKELSKEKCLNNVINNTSGGSIVVFHDSIKASENLFYVLPRILDYYSEKGFSFKNL